MTFGFVPAPGCGLEQLSGLSAAGLRILIWIQRRRRRRKT